MIVVRKAEERGRFDFGWLDTRHTFSFGDYYDAAQMGFRALRVINEDRVRPGAGFPTHSHRDMEIVSYVLSGRLEHRDSLGNRSAIRPGEVQRMTAGTGVTHSEYNPSPDEPVHFLQIWILPERPGLTPGYEQKAFPDADGAGRLQLVASPDGAKGSVRLHQDVRLYRGLFPTPGRDEHPIAAGRHTWVQVARGSVSLNGQPLAAGDGAAVSNLASLTLAAEEPSEVLLFDLA